MGRIEVLKATDSTPLNGKHIIYLFIHFVI